MGTPLQINTLTFTSIEARDINWYKQRPAYEETSSLLYPLVRAAGFERFLDIGANYGLVGMLAARQGLPVLCIEADPRLVAPIEQHFAANGLACVAVVNAIAGARADDTTTFCFNPSSTLDNRVDMPNWERVPVPTRRAADVIAEHGFDAGRLFIKIDTQGFEENVLAGLAPYLDARQDWAIKMEFAPHWLASQGTDAVALLRSLAQRFEVVEFPERITWGTSAFEQLFVVPITPEGAGAFVAYVRNLNYGDRGWVDLLVRPRSAA
jgi:FkbM family methyltransferase